MRPTSHASHHPERHGQAVDARVDDAERARELARDGHDDQRCAERDRGRVARLARSTLAPIKLSPKGVSRSIRTAAWSGNPIPSEW